MKQNSFALRKTLWGSRLAYAMAIASAVGLLSGCTSIEYKSDMPAKQELQALAVVSVAANTSWSQQVGSGVGKTDAKLAVAGNDSVVIAADSAGQVMAFDRATGNVKWKVSLKKQVAAGPTIAEGKVFLGTRRAEVIALNIENGTTLWQAAATSEVLAAPVVHDGMVFIHPLDGGLAAIRADDGRQLWRFSLNIPPLMLRRSSSPVITADYAIAGFANGKVVAINRMDGTVDWSQDVSSPKGRSDVQRMVDISADPIVANEVVYAVAYQGNLAAFALSTGQPIWNREISSYSGMVLAHDVIYVAAVDGEVWAVDKNTGNTLWRQPQLKGRKLSRPVMQKDFVVVADDDGYLHWLVAATGQLAGRFKTVGNGIEAAPLVFGDVLYVYSKNGKVSQIITK